MTPSAFEIAASGMAAHRAEMDVIAENIANAGAGGSAGRAFRPHAAVIVPSGGSTFADAFGSAMRASFDGSAPSAFSIDDAAGQTDAGAGDAFASAFGGGYVPQPVRFTGVVDETPSESGPAGSAGDDGIDSISEMVSLVAAGRAYDADVASLQAAKQMDVEAIEVDRS